MIPKIPSPDKIVESKGAMIPKMPIQDEIVESKRCYDSTNAEIRQDSGIKGLL